MTKMCGLCGGIVHELVSEKDRHGNDLKTVICMGCGIITNDPIPTDEELAAFYKNDYRKDYKGTSEPRMRQVWRNFGRIENHLKTNSDIYNDRKKCLDLGSGSGEFMFLATALGISCTGIEPNDGYAEYCKHKLGLDVKNQRLEDTQFKDGEFDLIRLSHVLEHMRDPVRSLIVLHKWLSDDGILYIEVPNIEHDAAHKIYGRMFHFGHIFNFNPQTLRLAAGLAGFSETPQSASRLSNTTGAFFCKSDGKFQTPNAMKQNAALMKKAMDGHNTRTLPKPKSGTVMGRLISTIATRLGEMAAARKFADHRAIADEFARRSKAANVARQRM